MKKIFTLALASLMTLAGYAQDAADGEEVVTETWNATKSVTNNTVELENITAEFLNNTSKGSVAGAGSWSFSNSYATGDQNGLEIKFTPKVSGELVITFAQSIANNKSIWMYVDENTSNTMNATYNDPDAGEVSITCGVNLSEQGYASGIPGPVSYKIVGGKIYNFYAAGTKYRVKSFSFTPMDVEEGPTIYSVAYLSADPDEITASLFGEGLEIDYLDPSDPEITLAKLQEYDAVIVPPSIPTEGAIVSVLKSAIAYVPMLNLKAELYPVWELGQIQVSEETALTISEAYAEDELYSQAAGEPLVFEGALATIELGKYFANDEVVATIGDAVAVHVHNPGRNAYMNLPFYAANPEEFMPNMDMSAFFTGLATYVAQTKKGVTATTKPTVTVTNDDKFTTVTMKAAEGATIYYTLDGNDPTTASEVYSEELTFTEPVTLKAFATLDGYNDSPVSEVEVAIYNKVAAPEVALSYGETSTTITLSCATPDAKIYFSFQPFTDPALAQEYTEPVTLSQEPSEIYVMATADQHVNSELVENYVAIKSLTAETIRLDKVSHFYSVATAWTPAADRVLHESYENRSSIDYHIGRTALALDEVYEFTPNEDNGTVNDWKITTKGQVMASTYKDAPQSGVSDGTAVGRYADEAIDLIGLQNFYNKGGYAQFGAVAKDADENALPNSGTIESVKGFDAPFDIVVLAGNNSAGAKTGEIQTSTDGVNWEKLADLRISPLQRYIKKTRVSVEGTGKVWVRVANTQQNVNIYDIVIYNNGEESKNYVAPAQSGIEDIVGDAVEAEVVRTEIYGINGMLLPELTNGINIVRTYYSDGTVKTAKVAVRK